MLTMTDAAKDYLKTYCEDQAEGTVLVFSVSQSGCSGLKYEQTVTQDPKHVTACHHGDFIYYVDDQSVALLDNVVVDCETLSLGQKKIVYRDAKAEGVCGCGLSFKRPE